MDPTDPEIWTTEVAIHTDNVSTGTKDEPLDTGNLVGKYARHPNSATLFNYASMAHNNHFFFQSTVSCLPSPEFHRSTIKAFPKLSSGSNKTIC